jgi:hypothetical protein
VKNDDENPSELESKLAINVAHTSLSLGIDTSRVRIKHTFIDRSRRIRIKIRIAGPSALAPTPNSHRWRQVFEFGRAHTPRASPYDHMICGVAWADALPCAPLARPCRQNNLYFPVAALLRMAEVLPGDTERVRTLVDRGTRETRLQ